MLLSFVAHQPWPSMFSFLVKRILLQWTTFSLTKKFQTRYKCTMWKLLCKTKTLMTISTGTPVRSTSVSRSFCLYRESSFEVPCFFASCFWNRSSLYRSRQGLDTQSHSSGEVYLLNDIFGAHVLLGAIVHILSTDHPVRKVGSSRGEIFEG